jgi:hypothetical protein
MPGQFDADLAPIAPSCFGWRDSVHRREGELKLIGYVSRPLNLDFSSTIAQIANRAIVPNLAVAQQHHGSLEHALAEVLPPVGGSRCDEFFVRHDPYYCMTVNPW